MTASDDCVSILRRVQGLGLGFRVYGSGVWFKLKKACHSADVARTWILKSSVESTPARMPNEP